MNARPFLVGPLLAGWLLAVPAAAQDVVDQWKRWEKTIESTRDYTLGGGNPYRDLILRVEFTNSLTGQRFTQDAFWEGVSASPRRFKVRSAFPPGTWSWRVASCQGTTGGQNCATDPGWTPASGTVSVTAKTTTQIRLYDRGFPKQYAVSSGGVVSSYSPLYYHSDEIFFWVGDTAWAAPPREINNESAQWSTFLTNRKGKGFTAVLLAPAVAWTPKAGETWTALRPAAGFSFTQTGTCSQPIPNDCSRPRPDYWNAFDTMVQQANDQDLLVVIAGVLDPVRLGENGTYPNLQNAVDFARYLAARMAGSAVIFSPGFDDKVASRTKDDLNSVEEVMNAVGPALKAAAPRHLVTNHLGGTSTCIDYKGFQGSGWMTFFLFQSGHALSGNTTDLNKACPGRLDTETRLQAALRRAREMPLTLASSGSPSMPNYNGEGPYDKHPITTDEVDNRHRVRHAAYVSSLSDAKGFTYGAFNLGVWYQPGNTLFDLFSSRDMRELANRFRGRSNLSAWHHWILNQYADPEHDKKIVLASDSSSLVLAYLPSNSQSNITISTQYLPDLSCGGNWTIRWYDPPSGITEAGLCTPGTGRIIVSKPSCRSDNRDCDWLLELQRTGSGLAVATPESGSDLLETWSDTSSGDDTSAIYARLERPGREGLGERVIVSASGRAFQQAPRVGRYRAGYLLVWQAEALDGSLYGVFGQKLDRDGRPVGPNFQINSFTEHDQRDPAIATDAQGNSLVVWSSYGQDDDRGGIFGQRFDPQGNPVGPELALSGIPEGHQERPQIATDPAGNFVVAWETREEESSPATISLRRFDRSGRPRGEEMRIRSEEDLNYRLVNLEVTPLGDFSVRWMRQDSSGRSRGHLRQAFDPSGRPLGNPAQVASGE